MMDALEGRGYVTTPPLPASSPGCVDMMDMSPLPHKVPFVAHVELPSPTPGSDDTMMMETPIPRSGSLQPSKPAVAERKRIGLRRPSLSRAKGYTAIGTMGRAQGENQLPPFRFGAGGDGQFGSSPSTSLSLSECFEDSPPQERRPKSANSPCASMAVTRPKAHFNSLSGMGGVRNGSPITGQGRRTANPFLRPRKQYRRSLSMFESPGDVVGPKKEGPAFACTALQSVMDLEEQNEPVLPHFFPEDECDNIPRITRETMLEVLDGKYSDNFEHKMIIDCRFEYEYEGGHIDGAINYNDKELLASQLVDNPMQGRTLLIFHCEYSAHRAPIMARHIRARDRNENAAHYPKLFYPEIYILDGGYSGFFVEHRERCYPQAYVEMNAAEHVNTCEREMNRLRQNRRGLGRAQTYAFGQQDPGLDSPTAPSRTNPRDMSRALGASPSLCPERGSARRMVSF
ncbi:Rhodanese-like domain-containing protein [Parachaetomium inaequale]|uniref:M-phase inducer phosphatase n=1 Tax=Parachaetomium inaequale TaxID=2588326 RepID=A0AAN6PP66_9PEZI|nr:Rhodanese-like domain-containing protein [Parachaetomium inaequale]